MKRFYGHAVYVDSVGVRAGVLDPFAVAVMDEIGIDISRHRPKSFADLEDSSFDVIIRIVGVAVGVAVAVGCGPPEPPPDPPPPPQAARQATSPKRARGRKSKRRPDFVR